MTANLVFEEEVKRRQRMTDNLISFYETNTIDVYCQIEERTITNTKTSRTPLLAVKC